MNGFQVRGLARELYDQHFKAAQATPRGVIAKLCHIVKRVQAAKDKQIAQTEVSQ